jgi:hypothetical protein
MANKCSSFFDAPDHFREFEDHLNAQDEFEADDQYDAEDEPLLGLKPEIKHPGKRAHLKNLIQTGSEKLSKVTRNISGRPKKEPKSATSTLAPSTENTSRWQYDRFDSRVPVSVYELKIDLGYGRHPEILELAIKQKKILTAPSDHKNFSYKVLDAMLITIRDMRQNREFDAIQSQTLEQLGRPFEYTRFE